MQHSFPTRRASDLIRRHHELQLKRRRHPARFSGLTEAVDLAALSLGRATSSALASGDSDAVDVGHGRAVVVVALGGESRTDALVDDLRHLHDPLSVVRSEEHTSELQSLMRISYAVFCFKKKNNNKCTTTLQ